MISSTPKALIFDWGDTLMRVFPGAQGAMVDWPEVAAVDGVLPALQQLQGRYRLFVASNAVNSSAAQIQAALARVGLAPYFEQIFTMHELNARKPQPAFFTNLSEKIGEDPCRCVMIGDDLNADVLGPLQAGWQSVWYNPHNHGAPGLLPLQDGDMDRFSDLPALVDRLDLPRVATCLGWLQQQVTALNLIQHQLSVAAIAYQLALWMRANATPVDPLLAHRGGLLHDIGKIAPQKEGQHLSHSEFGAQTLESLGQPLLAEITRRHMLFNLVGPDPAPITWEQKLVYFADKLMERNGLVSLQERLDLLQQRYTLDPNRMAQLKPAILDLQAGLCRRAGVPVADLLPRLRAAFMQNK